MTHLICPERSLNENNNEKKKNFSGYVLRCLCLYVSFLFMYAVVSLCFGFYLYSMQSAKYTNVSRFALCMLFLHMNAV